MRITRSTLLALALGLALIPTVPVVGSTAGAATGSKTGLPQGVTPLSPEQEGHVRELLKSAETHRGLTAKRPVLSGTVEEEKLKGRITEALREEMPPGQLAAIEAALEAFGLIPESLDLASYYPELLTSQVAGYYDPARGYLSLVRRGGSILGPGGAEKAGIEPQRVEDMILVHELTHALQDQHFGLEAFTKGEPISDAAAARLALVEGDATLTMMGYLVGAPVDGLPGVEKLLTSLADDAGGMSGTAMDLPGSQELSEAPAFFRDSLLFSYFQGYAFAVAVRQKGGQALLDHAFRKDPPRSTEQILHPEKWLGRRDDPVTFVWPDLARELPGATRIAEGDLGELGIKILLREALGDAARATAAAEGWGGDRFAVYSLKKKGEKEGSRLLAWITEWDSEADAMEMEAAIRGLGAGWRAERPSPRRVVVLRGEIVPERLGMLRERLAAAEARRPENRDLDLPALGIQPPEASSAKLLESPLIQEQLKKVREQPVPAGTLSSDGRSYTNPALGVSLTLPESRSGWRLDPRPPAPLSLAIGSPDGAGQIVVAQQTLPAPLTAEVILPMVAGGVKASLPGYASLGSSRVEAPGGEAWQEERFEAEPPAGRKVRGLIRVWTRGTSMVFATFVVPADLWPEHERAAREILDRLAVGEPVAP
jgi:hypothetical protein